MLPLAWIQQIANRCLPKKAGILPSRPDKKETLEPSSKDPEPSPSEGRALGSSFPPPPNMA